MTGHLARVLRWFGVAGAGLWLATAVIYVASATAPQTLSQSTLATPERRSQAVVPSPTPITPYPVSPLRIDDAERPLLGDRAALWIGAAGLLLVGGSVLLVLTRRR